MIGAYIDDWWSGIKSEYENDETDKYKAYAKTIILNWSNRILFAHLIKFKPVSYTHLAGAIRHGISRALLQAGEDYRPTLKAAGFLTRDRCV